jgi:hypothetical protein
MVFSPSAAGRSKYFIWASGQRTVSHLCVLGSALYIFPVANFNLSLSHSKLHLCAPWVFLEITDLQGGLEDLLHVLFSCSVPDQAFSETGIR